MTPLRVVVGTDTPVRAGPSGRVPGSVAALRAEAVCSESPRPARPMAEEVAGAEVVSVVLVVAAAARLMWLSMRA